MKSSLIGPGAGAVLGVLCAAGCAGVPRGEPFVPEVVDPSRAVVYVYREAGLRGKPVSVFVNQEAAGVLLPGQYLCRAVVAAEVVVRVEGEGSAARPVRLSAGDAAYLEVRTPGLGATRPTLEVVESGAARRRLAATTRVAP